LKGHPMRICSDYDFGFYSNDDFLAQVSK